MTERQSAPDRASHRPFIELPLTLLFVAMVGVYAGARVSYAFAIQPAHVVMVWLPAGFVLAMLILRPRRDWFYVLCGAMLGNALADLQRGADLMTAVAGSAANAVESVVAAWVVLRIAPAPVTLSTVKELAAVGLGGAVVSRQKRG